MLSLSKQASFSQLGSYLFEPDQSPSDPLHQAHKSLYEEFDDEELEMYTDPNRLVRSHSIAAREGGGRNGDPGDDDNEDVEMASIEHGRAFTFKYRGSGEGRGSSSRALVVSPFLM